MNEDAPKQHPQAGNTSGDDDSRDRPDDQWPDLDPTQNDSSPGELIGQSAPEAPILATLCDPEEDATPIRVGSPFAVDPLGTFENDRPIEVLIDGGPLRYTAMGAVGSALLVLLFAAAAAWWFPIGGTMIASLGCVLSILGLYSNYRYTSIGLLTLHLSLFVVSYGRTLS